MKFKNFDVYNCALRLENARWPTQNHVGDCGHDLYTPVDFVIAPFSNKIIDTGVTIEYTSDWGMRLHPKGKHDHLIGAGVFEFGYQGDIKAKLVNYTPKPMEFKAGDAIAQMVFYPHVEMRMSKVKPEEIHREKTERGESGGIVKQYSEAQWITPEEAEKEWLKPDLT